MPARPRQRDGSWPSYPASLPRPAEGGVATSRQRGAMATTWWSQRFIAVLESYGLGTRMQRGRRYARAGQVLEVEVTPGLVKARVQGSRARPYVVSVALAVANDEAWSVVLAAMRAKVGFVARLLDGEVPADLEEVFSTAGIPLFPAAWDAVRASCSCPDWENPCKHIAAVLYVLADRLDADPWLVLLLRGRERDVLLGLLTAGASPLPEGGVEIAPWWPFGPGAVHIDHTAAVDALSAVLPGPADAVLGTMAPLPLTVGSSSVVELLRPLYDKLA
ncbi:MAG TPA: SWIM zinc finger family protein [Acidimicrobiales bacterium]|nr:SWIM zinc finger family protein [Acidimicrobiales bacterium]